MHNHETSPRSPGSQRPGPRNLSGAGPLTADILTRHGLSTRLFTTHNKPSWSQDIRSAVGCASTDASRRVGNPPSSGVLVPGCGVSGRLAGSCPVDSPLGVSRISWTPPTFDPPPVPVSLPPPRRAAIGKLVRNDQWPGGPPPPPHHLPPHLPPARKRTTGNGLLPLSRLSLLHIEMFCLAVLRS